MKAGSNIIYQLHYQSGGTPQLDQTSIAFVFADEPPDTKITSVTVQNFDFLHPAAGRRSPGTGGSARQRRRRARQRAAAHAPCVGKAFDLRAFYPDGREEVLLRVPSYDFNWQTTYVLESPKPLPRGTPARGRGHVRQLGVQPVQPRPPMRSWSTASRRGTR